MTLVEIEARGWDPILERLGCADAYLRRGYVGASCVVDGGEPRLLHLSAPGGDVVFALSVRPIPGSYLADATTPYGYGGPVATGDAPPAAEFWEAYAQWCARNGVVSTFLRFHPLFANHRYAASTIRLEPLAPTVAWDLRGSHDPADRMHRHHRRAVRKAARSVEVQVDEAPSQLDDFVALYEAAMHRRGADAFYLFPKGYWEALGSRFGAQLVRFNASVDGELVASLLCLATPPWLHYHLGASSERARSAGASNLLMLEAARGAKARGYECFHLGGGVGGREDSLHEYKRRFAPDDLVEARIGKAIHDEEAYAALSGGDASSDGFFPAYRREALASIAHRS